MGHVRTKTRSLGPMLEKPCERSRGHIFSPIVLKNGQNGLDEISDNFENGSPGQILEKHCSLTVFILGY